MNYRQLVCFLEVAARRNFSRASESLFTAPSVVSYQVSMLENDLGFPLFQRDKHNVQLTPAGESFYQDMTFLKSFYEKSVQKARSIHNQNSSIIRIGSSVYLEPVALGGIIAEFRRARPDTQINIVSPRYADYLTGVEKNDVDIAFVLEVDAQNQPGISFFPLFTRYNYFVVNTTNPLSKKDHLELDDLENQSILFPDATPHYRFASKIYHEILQKFPHTKVKLLEDFDQNAAPLVIANTHIAIYPHPEDLSENGVVFVPYGIDEPMQVGIAWRANDRSENILSSIEVIQKYFEKREITGKKSEEN